MKANMESSDVLDTIGLLINKDGLVHGGTLATLDSTGSLTAGLGKSRDHVISLTPIDNGNEFSWRVSVYRLNDNDDELVFMKQADSLYAAVGLFKSVRDQNMF